MKKFILAALLVSMLAMVLAVPAFAERAKDTCVASTLCSDSDISAYRWLAMANYYAGQPAVIDLTKLSDSDISAYRWEAMTRYYLEHSASTALTTLSDSDISAYRWLAMARFYVEQPPSTAINMP